MSVPELLTVADVMARYRLADRRSARRVMDEAGSFRIGAGLFVSVDDLLAHEARARAARRSSPDPPPPPGLPAARARQRQPSASRQRGSLPAGWWRTGTEATGEGRGRLAPPDPRRTP